MSEEFYLRSGRTVQTLEEFLQVLQEMPSEDYEHHVTEENNDFANWIQHSLHDEILAQAVSTAKTQDETITVIKKAMKPARTQTIKTPVKEVIADKGSGTTAGITSTDPTPQETASTVGEQPLTKKPLTPEEAATHALSNTTTPPPPDVKELPNEGFNIPLTPKAALLSKDHLVPLLLGVLLGMLIGFFLGRLL